VLLWQSYTLRLWSVLLAGKKGRSGRKVGSTNKVKSVKVVLGEHPFGIEIKPPKPNRHPKAFDKYGLTFREKRFVERYLTNGFDRHEAYLYAYPGPKTMATVKGAPNRLLSKPKVRRAIEDALKAAGIDERLIAQKIREGLEATRIVATVSEKGPDGEERLVKVRDIDYNARHRYLETLIKIRGDVAPKQVHHKHDHQVNVHPIDLDKFRLDQPRPKAIEADVVDVTEADEEDEQDEAEV